mmetsp:Transcript_20566/g.31354  ORF Transcript_20566/g.31354 Transcript_20566/m.31354 type:complete len:192 (+) Transcript_20566:155-730(+)
MMMMMNTITRSSTTTTTSTTPTPTRPPCVSPWLQTRSSSSSSSFPPEQRKPRIAIRGSSGNNHSIQPTTTFAKGFVRAGLPMILFSLGSLWVVQIAMDGKNKEREKFKGETSRSERQARMDEEKEDMMNILNKKMQEDFDNTKRIERPDQVLERRRKERERRNVWYRRCARRIFGNSSSSGSGSSSGETKQ